MNLPLFAAEVKANLLRAEESIQAAELLYAAGHWDFAAARAYFAAFYAANAALLSQGKEYQKHSGVIAGVHQFLVKTGKLDKKHGKNLNWLFELRGIGDYGDTRHVPQAETKKAIAAARSFAGIAPVLQSGLPVPRG